MLSHLRGVHLFRLEFHRDELLQQGELVLQAYLAPLCGLRRPDFLLGRLHDRLRRRVHLVLLVDADVGEVRHATQPLRAAMSVLRHGFDEHFDARVKNASHKGLTCDKFSNKYRVLEENVINSSQQTALSCVTLCTDGRDCLDPVDDVSTVAGVIRCRMGR